MSELPTPYGDVSGRVALVTGATSGIGRVAAASLAAAGARVLVGARDPQRGEDTVSAIRARTPKAQVEVLPCDVASLASVAAAAREVGERTDRLDVLLNNAGVMATPRRETTDGFELQVGTNHLGHHALTAQLVGLLGAAEAPRVVTVSSSAHKMGRLTLADLDDPRTLTAPERYSPWRAYGLSKLANLLFAFELDRRARAAGWPLRSLGAHPGYAATNLQQRGPRMAGKRVQTALTGLANTLVGQSPEGGAKPLLRAATDPDLPGGTYIGPGGLAEARGEPKVVAASALAHDRALAARLWEVSSELVEVGFGPLDEAAAQVRRTAESAEDRAAGDEGGSQTA